MVINSVGPNQTVLTLNSNIQVFFSYRTAVAAYVSGVGFFRTNERYSVTTSRHINKYLNGAKATSVDQAIIDRIAQNDLTWMEQEEEAVEVDA